MAYKNVLTTPEVATAFAGGMGASLFVGPFGMLVAAIVRAFYEQRKRRHRSD